MPDQTSVAFETKASESRRQPWATFSQWRLLQGSGHGCPGPAISVVLSLAQGAHIDVTRIDAALMRLMPEAKQPALPVPSKSPAIELVSRLLHWHWELQAFVKVAVPNRGIAQMLAQPQSASHSFRLVVPYRHTQAAERALRWVLDAFGKLMAPLPADELAAGTTHLETSFSALTAELARFAEQGSNPHRFLLAAHRLNWPAQWVTASVLQVGQGARSRLLQSSLSDLTSTIAVSLARDKVATASLLLASGLPGAVHEVATSADEAVRIAARLGWPVVVKPQSLDQGKGVAAHLVDEAHLRAAWAAAAELGSPVLVERHVFGDDCRLTVMHGQLIKALVRRAGGVLGDGQHSVAHLLQLAQGQPSMQRRARQRGGALLALDEEALALLAEQGLQVDDVPASGRWVGLRRRGNISAGGTPQHIDLDEVHPDNAQLAVMAAQLLRLELAGVDLLTPDVRKSWREGAQPSAICEVNAQPQIGLATTPGIFAEILQRWLPEGARIPLVLEVDAPEPTAPRADGNLPGSSAGQGWSHKDGIAVDARWSGGPFESGFHAARALLRLSNVHHATCHMNAAEVQTFGLPSDVFDVIRVHGPAGQNQGLLAMLAPHAKQLQRKKLT